MSEPAPLKRKCSKCEEIKNIAEFYKSKYNNCGVDNLCRECRIKCRKKYETNYTTKQIIESIESKTNLEKKNFYVRQNIGSKNIYGTPTTMFKIECFCGNSKEISRKTINKNSSCGGEACPFSNRGSKSHNSIIQETDQNNFFIKKNTWNEYFSGAKKRDIEFNIQPIDILNIWNKQQGRCNKTNIKLTAGSKYKKNHNWSINRIDSNKGYTVDNIEIVHKFCNIIQNRFSDKAVDVFCVARALTIINNNKPYGEAIKKLLEDRDENLNTINSIWNKQLQISNSHNKGKSKNPLIYDIDMRQQEGEQEEQEEIQKNFSEIF